MHSYSISADVQENLFYICSRESLNYNRQLGDFKLGRICSEQREARWISKSPIFHTIANSTRWFSFANSSLVDGFGYLFDVTMTTQIFFSPRTRTTKSNNFNQFNRSIVFNDFLSILRLNFMECSTLNTYAKICWLITFSRFLNLTEILFSVFDLRSTRQRELGVLLSTAV